MMHINRLMYGVIVMLLVLVGVASDSRANGDFTGNGQRDLAMYNPITRTWYLQTVAGAAITTPVIWGDEDAIPLTGDFNGDGISDLAVYHPATGRWDIRGVDGTILAQNLAWGAPGAIPLTGRFGGSDADDLVYYLPQTGAWHIRTLGGTILANGMTLGIANAVPVPGDYNKNGIFDLAVYVESSGTWYIRTLAGTNIVWGQSWGLAGALPVPGDFNGDGFHNMAVYAPASGKWYIRHVNGNVLAMDLTAGPANAVALAGSFSGNPGGAADLAVFGPKPSLTWGMRSVTGDFSASGLQVAGAPAAAVPVGPLYAPGDINYMQYKPLNDFNGDGASDFAVYHPDTGQWFIRTLGGQTLAWYRNWGYPGTVPVPADYTGNGIADLGIYDPRNGKWYIVTMDHQMVAAGVPWGGFDGAIPVPGDYDGDGVADLGIYDRNTGDWYVWSLARQQAIVWRQPWGWRGDVRPWERPPTSTVIPVPYDYDGDGRTDLAVYYRGWSMADSQWHILGSQGTVWSPVVWGSSGSIPAPGTYHNMMNPAFYPPGINIYKVKYSPPNDGTDGTFYTPYTRAAGFKVGVYGRTLPVAAMDFNGSGYDDYAVYDYLSGRWSFILNDGSASNFTLTHVDWGFPGAVPANLHSTILFLCGYGVKPW